MFNGMMRGDGVDQRRAVEQADVPIAMVNGSKEPFARLTYVNDLSYGTLWSGHCHVMEGVGHPPFWERPAEFNELLSRFVGDVAAVETLHSAQDKPATARAS
jgi:pimeloyl-ACP methyl ester carboxylesterase